MLKSVGKKALKNTILFISIMAILLLLNLTFCIIALFKIGILSKYFGLSLLIGALAIGGIGYLLYRYILFDILSLVYEHLKPLFRKICTKIIGKTVHQGNKISQKEIIKNININNIYEEKLPKYVQKGINLLLQMIPFSSLISQIKENVSNTTDEESLSNALFIELDNYIIENIFGGNTLKPIAFIFLINIIAQSVCLYYFNY